MRSDAVLLQKSEADNIVALSSNSMFEGVANWLQISVPSLVEGSKVRWDKSRGHMPNRSPIPRNKPLRCEEAIPTMGSAMMTFSDTPACFSGEQPSQGVVSVAAVSALSVTLMDNIAVETALLLPVSPSPRVSRLM